MRIREGPRIHAVFYTYIFCLMFYKFNLVEKIMRPYDNILTLTKAIPNYFFWKIWSYMKTPDIYLDK